MSARFDRLRRATAVAGWAGPGSRVVLSERWDVAERFVQESAQAGFPAPHVKPRSDGTIRLTWKAPQGHFCVEIDTPIYWALITDGGHAEGVCYLPELVMYRLYSVFKTPPR